MHAGRRTSACGEMSTLKEIGLHGLNVYDEETSIPPNVYFIVTCSHVSSSHARDIFDRAIFANAAPDYACMHACVYDHSTDIYINM